MNSPKKPEQITDSESHVRLEKIKKLQELGVAPWAEKVPVSHTTKQAFDSFVEESTEQYSIAGRVIARRLHGKAGFAKIQDRAGSLQVYVREDVVGPQQFELFEHMIDLGDIVWCKGTVFKTKTGEITLRVEQLQLLTKCLHPLPEKFHGISDIETKYRQRYLDLITSSETRERFVKRSQIINKIRAYLDKADFVEVETPMLHPIPGGAAARPFVTHHNALDSDFYLRIAPELYLKRLVVGGVERVYEINRNFRNEGVSTRHNPEFTMLEMYMAHEDYHHIMTFIEQLFRELARTVAGSEKLQFGEQVIDFSQPFERLSAAQAIVQYGDISEQEVSQAHIDATLKKHAVSLPHSGASYGEKVFALFEKVAEHKLIQPTYIIDFPIETSPLAKRDAHNKNIAARFELFIAGMEISNGFNELNDPFDQADRFKQQAHAHAGGNDEAMHYDAEYITALEYGLPPTVGVGVGIDRLVMLLTNTTSIKEVILFPTLKRKL